MNNNVITLTRNPNSAVLTYCTEAQKSTIRVPRYGDTIYQTDGIVGLYVYKDGWWKDGIVTTPPTHSITVKNVEKLQKVLYDETNTVTLTLNDINNIKKIPSLATLTDLYTLVNDAPNMVRTLNILTDTLQNTTTANALLTTIAEKAPTNNPVFTGNVGGLNKTMVGLNNVDNTADLDKPISNAVADALTNKVNFSDVYTRIQLEGFMTGMTASGIKTKTNTVSVANAPQPFASQVLTATSDSTAVWADPHTEVTLQMHNELMARVAALETQAGIA
jgi:hypothetical protein